jgi:predicted DNA-binding protein (MmcQ/YjbR family)
MRADSDSGPADAQAFRHHALAQPMATEAPHFQACSFRVLGKIFAQLSADGQTGTMKLPPPIQAWAVDAHPTHCAPEPHWGKHGWTRVTLAGLPHGMMADLIAASWRTVAPKKLRDQTTTPPAR